MDNLQTIIADDERPARSFLKNILRDFEDVELVGEAENGAQAIELIKSKKPDLVLLDLQMPEISGLEVIKSLSKTQMPLVVFVTAYDEYAIQAFDANAVDYLLKPIEKARLRQTINRAKERLEHKDFREREGDKVRKVSESYIKDKNEFIKRIPIKNKEEILLVSVEDIASIIADGELLYITTLKNVKYTINFRLKDIEAKLSPEVFIRLSRGALANVGMFEKVSPMPGGTYLITLKNGQEIPSSRFQSKVLRERLLKL